MADGYELLRRISGQTKAHILVNEFLGGTLQMPEIKELMALLAVSDLERIGILELVRQELESRGAAQETRDLLLGGLKGSGTTPPGPAPTAGGRKTISVMPFSRKTDSIPRPEGPGQPAAPSQTPAADTPTVRTPPPGPAAGPANASPTRPAGKRSTMRAPQTFFGSTGAAATFGRLEKESTAKPIILVGDDDPRIRMIFRMKLEKAGYKVIEATDGEETWEKIESASPAATVMDMKMPGLHGLEILARLTRENSELPVVVCSAYDQLKDEFVVSSYPRLKYFVKPVNADEMVAAVKEMVPLPEE
jgi:CheY-like chemotaxis protein